MLNSTPIDYFPPKGKKTFPDSNLLNSNYFNDIKIKKINKESKTNKNLSNNIQKNKNLTIEYKGLLT